ncbi:MAG: nucleotidyl transferase AbiEii/AbiGii toxin family protein [Terriglobales bacterium]
MWSLQALFGSPQAKHLVFKGGTSLSKAYNIIRRFSEDVDLTYDIHAIASDLVNPGDPNPIPPTRSQGNRWTKKIRKRLSKLIETEFVPLLSNAAQRDGLDVQVGFVEERVSIEYDPLESRPDSVRPAILVDFGARSTGEPTKKIRVSCDIQAHVAEVAFPRATARVMLPERTFWEKATAVHVFCAQGKLDGERLSRHWHDLTRLDRAGVADRAIADRKLAGEVAIHKNNFFREKDSHGNYIDYCSVVSGSLVLTPEGQFRERLAEDYSRMVNDGLLGSDDVEPFDNILGECKRIEDKANAVGADDP